jgi:hypothetical protein
LWKRPVAEKTRGPCYLPTLLFADVAIPNEFVKFKLFGRHAIDLLVPSFAAFPIQLPDFGVAAEWF